jgi:DNA-binding GntR family transcriptional regulator
MRPIVTGSVHERVLVELRRCIVTGVLVEGRGYSQRELAAGLGVSIVPLREALRTLAAQGLVVTDHRRGVWVTPLHVQDLAGIYRMRRLIEPELAARASHQVSEADLAVLRKLTADLGGTELGGTEGASRVWCERHLRWHHTLLESVASTAELDVLTMLWWASERYAWPQPGAALSRAPQPRPSGHLPGQPGERGGLGAGAGHHGVLVEAFTRHDATATRDAMITYLDQSHRDLRHRLAERAEQGAERWFSGG